MRIFALLALFIANSSQAATIDTTTQWDGSSFLSSFGEGSTDTYGQTFAAPDVIETALGSFSFWVDDRLNPQSVNFSAYVMEWIDPVGIQSSGHATGPVLYQSTMQTTTNNNGQNGMEKFTFIAGGFSLDPVKKYVAFLSSSLFWDGVHGSREVGALPLGLGVYADGEAVIISNGNVFSLVTEGGWNTLNRDFAFVADFGVPASIPLPATVGLLIVGLAGLTAFRKFV